MSGEPEHLLVHDCVTGEAYIGTYEDLAREIARYDADGQPAERRAYLVKRVEWITREHRESLVRLRECEQQLAEARRVTGAAASHLKYAEALLREHDQQNGACTERLAGHDWQEQHDGKVFVNLNDPNDAVSYEKCADCGQERTVKWRRT